MKETIKHLLENAISFEEFVTKTKKNQERLNAVFEQVNILDDVLMSLRSIIGDLKLKILAIGENWCTDCVLVLPILNKISTFFDTIEFFVVSRDEVFNEFSKFFLTAGKAKIPFVLFLNEHNEEVLRWVERSNYMFKKIFELKQRNLEKVQYYKEAINLYLSPESIKETTKELLYVFERAVLIAKSAL